MTLIARDGSETALPSKVPYKAVQAGDRFVAVGPSGGGYGDPRRRDPALVLDDVLDELIDRGTARDVYGVVIRDGQVDLAATHELRGAGR